MNMFLPTIAALVCLCGVVLAQTKGNKPRRVFLPAMHNYLLSLAYSRDGRHIAYCGTEPRIVIAETNSGKQDRELLGHENTVTALAFAPDGRALASASIDGTVKLWNWRTGDLLRSLGIKEKSVAVFALAFNDNGDQIVDIRSDSLITVWDVEKGTVLFRRQLDFSLLTAVLFSDDGRLIVGGEYGGHTGRVQIWDFQRQSISARRDFPSSVTAMAAVPDHDKIFVGFVSGEVVFYDFKRGRIEQSWRAHEVPIREIRVSANARILATAVSWETPDVKIWSISKAPREIHRFIDDDDGATTIRFSPDNREIAVIGRDNKIRFWDVVEGNRLRTITPID